jgi:magnesium-transporting ATPase (P-type)
MLETLVMTLEIVRDAAGGGLKCSTQEDTALLSHLQKKDTYDLQFITLMPHLRIFTLHFDGIFSTHRFAILDSIPYVSERARNNHYVVRCGDDNQAVGEAPLLCMKGSRSEITRLCGSDFVESMPFMGDMDRHASNCKRILFFTRCVVDSGRLMRARDMFDEFERVTALTELEAQVFDNKEFVFACLGSQDMQDGVKETFIMSRQRGVVFGMCTGDDPRVARSIMLREMEKAGFAALHENCRCVQGSELVAFSPAQVADFVAAAKSCGFFCVSNAKPEHKQRVVQARLPAAVYISVISRGIMLFRCSRLLEWRSAPWATVRTTS